MGSLVSFFIQEAKNLSGNSKTNKNGRPDSFYCCCYIPDPAAPVKERDKGDIGYIECLMKESNNKQHCWMATPIDRSIISPKHLFSNTIRYGKINLAEYP